MSVETLPVLEKLESGPALHVYMLGAVEFDAALAFQRRLSYEIAGDRRRAALVLCEHRSPLITVGRHGSRAHILCEPADLRARQWQVRWVNRGGGCLLHLPGQLAVYPVLALEQYGLGVQAYLQRLEQVVIDLLAEFGVRGVTRPAQEGVWVGSRLIAGLGLSVRDWVTYYGAYLNINPALDAFRLVRSGGPADGPMTSLERERHGPLRPSLARERLLEHFAARFGFGHVSFFSDHPTLAASKTNGAVSLNSRGPSF
jgi:lipoyl(octanoyl) transferase